MRDLLFYCEQQDYDDKKKFEEIEVSHTLGGSGEGGVQGRGKWRGYTYYSVVRYTKVKW